MTAKCTRAVDGAGWKYTRPARCPVRAPCSAFPLAPAFAPPTRPRLAPPTSPASSLLQQGPTSPARASSATALRPSRCGPPDTLDGQARDLPVPEQGASVHAGVYDHAGSRRVLAVSLPSMLPSV